MGSKKREPAPDDGTTQANEGAASPTTASRPAKLTRAQLIAQHATQAGKCWVSGQPLGDDFVVAGGKLISKSVNEIRGGRTLDGLREKLSEELTGAVALVATFGKLRAADGSIVFAGETPRTPDDSNATTAAEGG